MEVGIFKKLGREDEEELAEGKKEEASLGRLHRKRLCCGTLINLNRR